MGLNRTQIFETLKKYELDGERFIILSGASMVLQGIKEQTSDIDITVDKEYYNYLSDKFKCTIEKVVEGEEILYIDDVINFATNLADSEWELCEGYKIQTAQSIKALKQKLGREKDKKDIALIDEFLSKKK